MKYSVTAALVVAFAQYVSGLTVNTPSNLVQCQPILLSWADGTPPYYLSIIPGGQPDAPALEPFPTTEATSMTWIVDIPSGTSITVSLKDNTGAMAYSDMVTIQPNPQGDKSCPPSSASASGAPGSTSAGATPAVAATTGATPATSPSAAGATTARPAASSGSGATSTSARPSGSQAAASTTATGSAVRTSVTFGLGGLLAAVGAALF